MPESKSMIRQAVVDRLHGMACDLINWSDNFDEASANAKTFGKAEIRKDLHALRVDLLQTVAQLDKLDADLMIGELR